MTGVNHYQHSGSKGKKTVDESLAISTVQMPSFISIGATGIKERLMHDLDQYVSIL